MKINRLFANVAGKALALATVMMMSMVFTACSKDNDDPKPDPEAGKYVDLGLPSGLKWATCNLGATKPEEYGDYYAWGETAPKDEYKWDNYKWGGEHSITKYSINSQTNYKNEGFVDGKTVLEAADDAATAKLGTSWRMPTGDEIDELIEKCTWEWTQLNGVKGHKVTGPNGKFIFLPAAGYRKDTALDGGGKKGFYWSSSLLGNISVYYLYIGSSGRAKNYYSRYYGFPVRPVCR